jgi:hypothetical protein
VSTGVADCAVAAAGRGRQELPLLFARLKHMLLITTNGIVNQSNDNKKTETAFHFDADPDPRFDADPDPTDHFSPDSDPPMFQNEPLKGFHIFTLTRVRIPLITLMRIQIQLSTLMRIQDPASQNNADPFRSGYAT